MLALGDGEVGDDEETDEGMYVGDDDISDNLSLAVGTTQPDQKHVK